MKPVIIAPLVALALAGGAAGAYFWVTSGGGEEEVVVSQPTPTPTQPPGGAGGGGFEGTVVPITTPFPSPPPVPADWATYSDPDGRFTLRYPPSWFIQNGATSKVRPPGELTTVLSTFELGTVGPRFPRDSIKLDVIVQRNDPANPPGANCQSPPEDAASANLGDVSGWQRVIDYASSYDTSPDGLTRMHAVVVFRDGYCFSLTAYFAQDSPDEATFSQIVNSFTFTS